MLWREQKSKVRTAEEWRAYQVVGGCLALVSLLGGTMGLAGLTNGSKDSALMIVPSVATFLTGLSLIAYGYLRNWWEFRQAPVNSWQGARKPSVLLGPPIVRRSP